MLLLNVDVPYSNEKNKASLISDGNENVVIANNVNVAGQIIVPLPTPAERLPERWKVPSKNEDFVGRDELLKQIKNYINQEGSTLTVLTACHGLGGIGKTQVALEFVWRYYQENKDHKEFKGIAWFDAESQERLRDDYISLGQELHIILTEEKLSVEEGANRIKHWLEHPERARWLLVYDNAPSYKTIDGLVPTSGGRVLVTSRNTQWSSKSIEVNVFDPEESRAYIQRVLSNKALDISQVDSLGKTLGHLPLALAQACAYIKKNLVSIERYLKLYETRKRDLLNSKTLPLNYSVPVYITWDITMEVVRKESLLADRWLTICAYLNSKDIPNFLLESFANSPENNPKSEIFEEALGTLISYSMLTVNEESSSTSIHRLVQEVIQLQSEEKSEAINNRKAVYQLFGKFFPYLDQTSKDYSKMRQSLPHLESFLCHLDGWLQKAHTDQLRKEIEENYLEDVLSWMVDGHHNLGNWQKEGELLERVFTILKRHYGHNHLSTLTTRNNIAVVLYNQGKYEEALQAYQEVYDIWKNVLGPEHPSTLTTRNNMAKVLDNQGKYEEALQAYQEVYDIWKNVLGPEHPSTLTIRNNMALVLDNQGKYEEALQVYQEVYDIWKNVLGPEHPSTLTIWNNMALVLFNQGKYEEAYQAYQEVYDIWKNLLGPEHPSTLTTRNNIAGVLDNQGKYEEALQAYQEVYDIWKNLLGPEHPSTLTTRNNIAGVLDNQGKYEEALQAYQEVYEIKKRVLGPEHPSTLTTRNNMALVLSNQGKYEEALQAYQKVCDICKNLLGPEHPSTLTTRNNIAGVLDNQGKYEEALQAYQGVYDIWKNVLGPEHRSTLTTRNNIAGVLSNQGKYEEALQAYQEVYDIWKNVLGPEHPSTLTTRNNIAGVLSNQGKNEEALQAYQEVYDIRKRVLGPEHPDALNTAAIVSRVLTQQGKYEEALHVVQEAFAICKRVLEPDHPITKDVLRAFELLHAKTGSQPGYEINKQLFVAVKNGDIQWVRDCIRGRANVDSRDNNNWTPLHYAAEKGYVELVSILLLNRASINAENNGKATPLHFAARNGHIKVVEALLSSRATVNATTQNNNWTPLHFAAKHNHIAVVKALIKHGTFYDARDSQGRAPAQLTSNPEISELLNIIDKLFNCVREGNLNELISYLNKRAEVNSCSSDEKTLLQLAVEQNHLELASVLLEHGANVNKLNENQQVLIAEFNSSNSIQSHET
jgi:tetratricopeptide (TPR) repeat protein